MKNNLTNKDIRILNKIYVILNKKYSLLLEL